MKENLQRGNEGKELLLMLNRVSETSCLSPFKGENEIFENCKQHRCFNVGVQMYYSNDRLSPVMIKKSILLCHQTFFPRVKPVNLILKEIKPSIFDSWVSFSLIALY